MATRQYEKPLHLDLPFNQALARFAQTNPKEVVSAKPKKTALAKKRKAKKHSQKSKVRD
jgi:hypothetical protein